MKEFEFRLQSLLDLREQEEQAIQKELFEVKSKYREIKTELDDIKQQKRDWQEKLTTETEQGISCNDLIRYRNYIEYLIDETEELKLQLDYWQQKVEDCQQKLLDKMKERKTLSKLKEKRYNKYQKEFLQEQQRIDDEIAINNFNHQAN
ncbi:flagellar export protein FliJ [Halanaerocella petrolearia]